MDAPKEDTPLKAFQSFYPFQNLVMTSPKLTPLLLTLL